MKSKLPILFAHPLRMVALIFPAVVLVGCTSTDAMRNSFNDYSGVYAETQNNQMLLNLARLHEGFPIYFFQLGQISASYTFTETAGLTGTKSKSIAGVTPTSVLAGTANIGETVTHNPIFTLVPLAGNMFAAQLLRPISPTVFEQNFEQGWPVDQLMRILVERIEITVTTKDKDGNPKEFDYVFENNPWDGEDNKDAKNEQDYRSNVFNGTAGEPTGYDHFLRACALARACQKAGVLHLVRDVVPVSLQSLEEPTDATKAPVIPAKPPADPSKNPAATPDNPTAELKELSQALKDFSQTLKDSTQALKDSPPAQKDSSQASKDAPTAPKDTPPASKDSLITDVTNADKGGLAYQQDASGTWQIVKNVERASFKFDQLDNPNGKMKALLTKIGADPVYKNLPSNITLFEGIINSGFSISDKTSSGNPEYQGQGAVGLTADSTNSTVQVKQVSFVMRSLMGVITDLATEQQAFDARNKDPQKGNIDPLTIKEGDPRAAAVIPDEENRPLLTLTWPNDKAPGSTIAALDFENKHFAITDDLTADPHNTWNRDVFRMLVQLSFEVTTDASTLPVTPTVSVRGN